MKKIQILPLVALFLINFISAEVDLVELINKAEKHYDLKEYNEAISTATEAIKLDSTIWRSYFIRAESYGFISDFNSALADYTKVINLKPDSFYYGVTLYQINMAKTVLGFKIKDICPDLALLKKLIIKNNDLAHLTEKNVNLFICEEIEKIEQEIEIQIEEKEGDKNVNAPYESYKDTKIFYIDELNNLAVELAMNGLPINAIPIFKQIVHLDPLRDKAYNNISNCYYDLGFDEKSLEFLHKCISINPNNEQALRSLSSYYYDKDLNLSLEYAKKGARLGNEHLQKWLKERGDEY